MIANPRPRLSAAPRANLPEAFIDDEWYVAAWAEDITRAPSRRIMLDEPIVMYRTLDGTAIALLDRCVHRAYPLSAGCVDGDTIVCGYHGFELSVNFDRGGLQWRRVFRQRLGQQSVANESVD